ncbi:serine/threonine protein kinase [Actinomadura luteofluorescens]|uniref:non-specific serine/threonine protein kinase n=1 Tax=Actinomadura luteofluorescens TaxID=46163 RepID=A0A7Y9EKY2_9ACTN|nr:serine/threonine-protein kinase [Actinomadura luteofluorescens]NYD49587.1 serine/threonine protein kinase [Actinomadura luteofluorescens]
MPNEPTGERLLARRYRLVTQVGRGGMGTVWQAHDEVLGRDVAVKEVILPHGLTDEERAVHHKRTFREARTAARLSHPGVVAVYDVVEEDDRPWIIMELIRARSLDQVIKAEGPMEARRAAEIARQMLAALHAAHEAGVLHRDVKPSNVLITGTGRMGERAVLTDFGIATASGDATLTQTGLVMGSPAYIAPERARGRVAGPASDLWSLGVTLYAMLHGKSPFERPEPMAALVAVISDEPDPPEKGGRLVPVIEGLLRKNPDQRMDAIEAGRMLDEIVRQETVDTQRTMAVEYPVEESPGTQTTMPEAPEEAPRPADAGARPDQLTSFDLPMGKPSARESANPAETAPDPDRVRSWRPGPGTQPAGRVTVPSGGPEPGPDTHFPPTTHHPSAGRPALASNRNVLIIAGVVLLVILVVAGIALASSGGDGDDGKGAKKSASTPPATGKASSSSPVNSKAPSPAVPAGFRTHKDRSGYSVQVPEEWKGPERKNGGDFFYAPGRKTYIQIDQTDDPGPSAIDDWRRQERGGSGWPGYEKLKIAATGDHPPVPDTGNGDKSADWEFTYDGDGGRVHILNRGFVTKGHGYAILLRAPAGDWDETYSELQPVYRSFKPADA